MTARLCLVAALAASVLGACKARPDETAVRNAVNSWSEAVASHHGAAACARLSSELRKRIERHLLGEGTNGNCDTWAARWVSPRHPASHRDARITAIRIRGAHATVNLVARGVPTGPVTLVQENGRWLIDNY
jgi:anti-sigma-K factor RskA